MRRDDGKNRGVPEEDEGDGAETIDDSRTTIGVVLTTPGDSMLYVYGYGYGDNWRHDVTREKILPALGMVRPVCLAGERHCPPEDVGGVPGYAEFLEVIFEPGQSMSPTLGWRAVAPQPLGGTLSAGGVQHNGGKRRPLADAMAKRLDME